MATNILGRVIVEITRQIGTGLREHLRERRLRKQREANLAYLTKELTEVVQLKKKDEPLIKTLVAMGFKEKQVKEAVATNEVKATDGKPLEERLRVALRVLMPPIPRNESER